MEASPRALKITKRKLQFSPLCTNSKVFNPSKLHKTPFLKLLDTCTDQKPSAVQQRAIQVQKRKTYLARSMLHLKSRRVLPMLISRGDDKPQTGYDKPQSEKPCNILPCDMNEGVENKENEVPVVENLSEKVKVMKMSPSSNPSVKCVMIF